MLKYITGLQSICDSFDLFLIDQFGVLHNGVEAYPYAVEALEILKSKNKTIVIISNSGKRSAINVHRIEKLGFHKSTFDQFITSGEVAFEYLEGSIVSSSLKTCFLISRDNDISAIDNLGLDLVHNSEMADLIIISGSEAERYSEEEYRELLRPGAKKNTRCICTNPDKQMLTSHGLKFGAGRIAEIYEELGGSVDWIGKPFPLIYEHILGLHLDRERSRTLCIGDSVEHDIAGGRKLGLTTMLIRTGILTDVNDDQLQRLFTENSVYPDYVAPTFCF